MTKIKDRFEKWKSKKWHQKLGDVLFYVILIMMIIPGPRKFIATSLNKVVLQVRKPSIENESNAYQLQDHEYNWDIRSADGTPVTAEDLKGNVGFLNFWGTYCPPCIAEMPEIQHIYNDYGDKVKFILVSAEDPAKVNNFLESRDYDLPAYFGGRQMPESLSYRSVPTTFIISKSGKIVTKKVGAANWNGKATRKVFDELLSRN